MIVFTDKAREVLEAAERAARRFDPEARVRLHRSPEGGVAFELTNDVGADDELVQDNGFSLVVERGLDGTVHAGDHNVLTLEPPA